MNSKDFTAKVQAEISGRLGPDYRVSVKEIVKNNGVILHGMLIYNKEQNVTPTIYLDTFREKYEAGESWDSIIDRILISYRNGMPVKPVDMDFFKNFEKVKDRIAYKIINAEKNKDLLKEIPHIRFLDLAVCFYYAFSHEELGNGSILIHNQQMEIWNASTVELLKLAQKNTRKIFDVELTDMENILSEMISSEMAEGNMEMLENLNMSEAIPMKVLSNRRHIYGAVVIILPGQLQDIAEEMNANLFILPSSVHEVILMADTGQEEPQAMREMVMEVNETQVLPEEILSDHVYYYDREKREICIVA